MTDEPQKPSDTALFHNLTWWKWVSLGIAVAMAVWLVFVIDPVFWPAWIPLTVGTVAYGSYQYIDGILTTTVKWEQILEDITAPELDQ